MFFARFEGLFFQPEALKANKIIEQYINGRFEINMEFIVNSFNLISINFSVPFTIINYQSIKAPPSGLRQFLATESPLKMKKNAFDFRLKTLFILKYLHFCPDFLVM